MFPRQRTPRQVQRGAALLLPEISAHVAGKPGAAATDGTGAPGGSRRGRTGAEGTGTAAGRAVDQEGTGEEGSAGKGRPEAAADTGTYSDPAGGPGCGRGEGTAGRCRIKFHETLRREGRSDAGRGKISQGFDRHQRCRWGAYGPNGGHNGTQKCSRQWRNHLSTAAADSKEANYIFVTRCHYRSTHAILCASILSSPSTTFGC
mmetsp:Transcript_17749/g.40224  ORF Transcript_17749/g.40224 Transcript_17749/m.40224 type:complete len:204 (-) Transcript_17749:1397-2008(-)